MLSWVDSEYPVSGRGGGYYSGKRAGGGTR